MKFHIRSAVAEDREKIMPLQQQIADVHRMGRPDIFKVEARYFDEDSFNWRLNEPSHYVFIAESDDGKVVGYAFGWVRYIRGHSTYFDRNEFYVDDVCVHSDFRRRGIGRALMEACMRVAKENNCYNMELGVYSFNKEAIALYESIGMKERSKRMEIIIL